MFLLPLAPLRFSSAPPGSPGKIATAPKKNRRADRTTGGAKRKRRFERPTLPRTGEEKFRGDMSKRLSVRVPKGQMEPARAPSGASPCAPEKTKHVNVQNRDG